MRSRPPLVPFRARDSAFGSLRAYRREAARWPFHAAGMHGHRFYVLDYFDGGEGELRLPRKTVKLGNGHVFLAPPGDLHDSGGIARMRGWVVEFNADLLPLQPVPGGRFSTLGLGTVPEAERASWAWRLERLVAEVNGARLGSLEAARGLLQVLLVDLARLLESAPRAASRSGLPLFREVVGFIERRYAEPGLSLAEIARAAGRSPTRVTAVVREQTGMTVLEWITARRMEEARRRLRETDEDIAIVAERVGYGDAAYFARVFRRVHGLSARAFRKAE
ncbi:MAG TPA: AraC family transcriptional regulator [Myxococcales bacterium]|jgi:AraC-like DNA-binding protein